KQESSCGFISILSLRPESKKLFSMTSNALALQVERRIYLIGAEKVMLDYDLAALYGVPTKSLNLAVKRNAARFPNESAALRIPALRFQNETSKSRRGGRRYLLYAFTKAWRCSPASCAENALYT